LRAFSPAIEVEAHVERLAGPAGVGRVVEGCDLVLDAADWPAHSIDRWVNEACTTRSIPHLTMSQHPPNLRVGPLYVPGVSGCFACRETQFRAQYAEYDALAASAPAASQAATFGPACAAVGAFAAAEAVHFLTGLLDPATIGRALTIDLRDLTTSWEEVTAVADCPVCARIPNSPSAIAN
jgi:bacteriocin biosynthesis cyclodehydratase domain-containing protein